MAFCPDCSRPGRPLQHLRDTPCPFRRRPHTVPCKEWGCGKPTWDDDGFCSDVCAASFEARTARQSTIRALAAGNQAGALARDGVGTSAGPGTTFSDRSGTLHRPSLAGPVSLREVKP